MDKEVIEAAKRVLELGKGFSALDGTEKLDAKTEMAYGGIVLARAILATPPADTTPDAALLAEAEHCIANSQRWLDTQTPEREILTRLAAALRERGQQLAEVTRERDHYKKSSLQEAQRGNRWRDDYHALDKRRGDEVVELRRRAEQAETSCGKEHAELLRVRIQRDEAIEARDNNVANISLRNERDAALARAEQAEAQLALHQRDACEHCGSKRIVNSRPGCLHCGAPNCCQTCCEVATLESDLAQARAQLALCAENTTAADLAQEVECLKAEKEALRAELARVRRDAAKAVEAAFKEAEEYCVDSDLRGNTSFYDISNARRAALAIGGEATQ